MSKFYSTHQWTSGAVSTVSRLDDETLGLKIQADDETMLTDIILGEREALCLAHSILSVLTHPGEEDE